MLCYTLDTWLARIGWYVPGILIIYYFHSTSPSDIISGPWDRFHGWYYAILYIPLYWLKQFSRDQTY